MNYKFYTILISAITAFTSCNAIFFTVKYARQNQIFHARFKWGQGIIVQYDNKQYTITEGTISFDMQRSIGNLSLGSTAKGAGPELDTVQLQATLNKQEFESFANNFDSNILSNIIPILGNKEKVLASTMENKSYDAIKDLMQDKFPGLIITIPQFSWINFAKSYWKYILGGLGLAGAGALYIYYDIKGRPRGWSDGWYRQYPWQFWRPTGSQLGWN